MTCPCRVDDAVDATIVSTVKIGTTTSHRVPTDSGARASLNDTTLALAVAVYCLVSRRVL